MRMPGARKVRLAVEELEAREVPSVAWTVETFESSLAPTLPDGWAQWSALPAASFQTSAVSGQGESGGLISTGSSDMAARAWLTGAYEKDIQITTDILLNSLTPVQIFIRGTNLATASPTYYALSLTRGLELSLSRVVNGQATTLDSVTSTTWLSGSWVRVSLAAKGDKLTVQVMRTDTGEYLDTQGAWHVAPVNAVERTDTAITAAGRVGIARPARVAGTVAFDNFQVGTDLPASPTTPIHEQAFNGVGLPSGWASYTNTQGQAFSIASASKILAGSSAIGITGSSGLVARAWYDTILAADVEVTASLYLDSLVPAQVFARGQDVNTDSPDAYAVSVTRGATIQLLRIIDGRSTVIGSLATDSWLSQQWVQVTLSVKGSLLRVQVYRADIGQYLAADGQWQIAQTWALEKTDTNIQGPGRAGIGRASGYAGTLSFDNFAVTSAATAATMPSGTTRRYDFDAEATGKVPTGWSVYNKGTTGAFQVASSASLSAPNGLASVGASDTIARAWFNGQTMRDVQITGAVFVDSLTPAQLLARGRDLGTDKPSYYAVSITRGMEVQLLEVVNGQTSVLATRKSATYVSSLWLTVSLKITASTLEVTVYRADTRQYLAADGTWKSEKFDAISTTDGTLAAAGYVGVNRPASYSGRIMFDDIALVNRDATPTTTPPDDSLNTNVPPGSTGGGTTNGTDVRHYTHIRIAQLAYYGTPIGDFEQNLLKNSVDVVVANPVYLDLMEAAAPNTPKLIYSNVSNIYLELLTDWLAWADKKGIDRESAFYHASKATAFTGDSSSSRPVSWFWSVERGSDATGWTDFTSSARKNAENVAFGALGQSVAIGYTEKFRELNLSLKSGASLGWTGVLEYASAVDAAGNPTGWTTLRTVTDTTTGFRTSGMITFDPPADWKAASINGSDRLFYIRVRTTRAGAAPVATTMLGRDYVYANGSTSGVVPAFDSLADKNRDGYLTDAEYATRRAGFNARFVYETRIFYPAYGQMRFATNVSNASFREWAVDFSDRFLKSYPKADGLFIDNSFGRLQVDATAVKESLVTYAEDYGATLGAINQKIAPRWVLANTAGSGKSADPIVSNGVSYLEEFALRPLVSSTTQFEDMAALVASRLALSGGKGYAILDTYPAGGAPTDSRTQIAALAYYYLLADPKRTMLMFNGGYEPATGWSRHWTDAVKYNVGQPTDTWSIFATGADPAKRTLTYKIFEREYQNALVLYKPLSYTQGLGAGTLADASATTHNLGGTYRMLNANGTLGSPVTRIILRNGEGAILIKV